LAAGAIIQLGSSHLFRFNNPGEAARLRQEMKDVSRKMSTDFNLNISHWREKSKSFKTHNCDRLNTQLPFCCLDPDLPSTLVLN